MDRIAHRVMKVGDLAARPGLTLESDDQFDSLDSPLFHGKFWHRELRRGLFLHGGDVFEDAGFTACSTQHAGISCVFFLEGEVDVMMGERAFHFSGSGRLREGLVVPSVRLDSFRRRSTGRQRVRHLVISATPEWLDRDGLGSTADWQATETFLHNHLDGRRWQVTPRLDALVERLMTLVSVPSELADLMIESAVIEILAETLSATTEQQTPAPSEALLPPRELSRLRRARDFILSQDGEWPSVELIAREAGLSASGLQRLFHAAYGASVFDHIRLVRLERARDMLLKGVCTIQEAASIAGYSSAANFSTAFKRQFGMTPGQVSRD